MSVISKNLPVFEKDDTDSTFRAKIVKSKIGVKQPISVTLGKLDSKEKMASALPLLSNWKIIMPNGGPKGQPMEVIIDSSFLHTSQDSQAMLMFVKQYFLKSQRSYFQLIKKNIPPFQSLDIDEKMLSSDDLTGKPYFIFVFDAAQQDSYSQIEDFLRLQKEFEPQGLRFLILSYDSKVEMQHIAESRKITCPILPDCRAYCKQFISTSFSTPYTIFLDKKGVVQEIMMPLKGDSWFESESACENCYLYNPIFEKNNAQKDFYYQEMRNVIKRFFEK